MDTGRLAPLCRRRLFYNHVSGTGGKFEVEYSDLEVEAAGKVDKADSGYSFSHIILRPHLKILGEGERARGFELLQKAESLCLVSRALAVTLAFEPVVEVKEPALG